MEVLEDAFVTPREVVAGAGEVVEFEVRHAVDEFGGFLGGFDDFF